MTAVAYCVVAMGLVLIGSSANAVFGPPSGLIDDQRSLAMDLARDRCEQSLSTSIAKRTNADRATAIELAEVRCGILLDGAAVNLPGPDQNDI